MRTLAEPYGFSPAWLRGNGFWPRGISVDSRRLRGYEALCFRSQNHQVRFLAESGRGLPQSTTLPRLTEAVWTTGAVGGTVRRGRVSGLQP